MVHRLSIAWVVLLCCGSVFGAPATVYVTTNGTGDGSSWLQAASLTNALVVVGDGYNIWLAQGSYIDQTVSLSSFVITNSNVTLYGGFTNGMTVLGQRNWTNYPTILDGTNGSRRVVDITSSNVTFDGLTIQRGGTLQSWLGTINGGGIRKASGGGALVLRNCTLQNNGYHFRSIDGACLYANGTDVCIDNCAFISNRTEQAYDEGMIYVQGGSLTASNSIFDYNELRDGSLGGAIYTKSPSRFVNCLFRGNETEYGTADGGAFYIAAGSATVTVENCTLVNNESRYDGGAFFLQSGKLVIKNSIMWGNAGLFGDGKDIYNNVGAGAVTVEYSCIAGMSAPYAEGHPTTFSNILTNNPQFAAAYADVHLKSTAGSWDPATEQWTNDTARSYCVDAGDPSSGYGNEPAYAGDRVNMGFYGNTAKASKSPAAAAPVLTNRAPDVIFNSAALKGELIDGTASDITFWYGTNEASLDLSYHFTFLQRTGTVFSATVGPLVGGKQYWYTCIASNGAGDHTASPKTNFVTAAAPSGGSDIIHVDKDAPGGSETGSDWVHAYKTIVSGVAATAGTTNTLWVAEGTYYDITVEIATNVTIYGGFTNGMTALGQRDVTAYPVILDGQALGRVVDITAGGVTLDGLTVQNGKIGAVGPGIRKTAGGGALILRNCSVLNNGRWPGGGSGGCGLYSSGTDVEITDCTFTNNSGTSYIYGGGIYLASGTLAVSNTFFYRNKGVYGRGGAVYVAAPARIVNCVFDGNYDPYCNGGNSFGGALAVDAGASTTVTVENCTIVDSSTANDGGAVYLFGGKLEVKNTIFWGNTCTDLGNTIYNAGAAGAITLENCCIEGTGPDQIDGASVTAVNIITANPVFVQAYSDVHLKSITGRWDPAEAGWTNDAVHSPCIDAGLAASDYSNEPAENGARVNLGAYGNTVQASKSPAAAQPVVTNRAPVVSYNVATIRGELIAGSPTAITFWYGTNELSLDNSVDLYPFEQTGTVFSTTLGDLDTNVQYWCTCYATNTAGTNWASPYTNFWTSVPPSGGANIIHVDKNAPSPVETGRDWCNAFKTVGVGTAVAGGSTNTMWIAQGTYTVLVAVAVDTNMTIYGGFTNGMTSLAERNWSNYPAAIDGRLLSRVMDITAGGVALDGVTIQNGQINAIYGAGIRKSSGGGTLKLVNCSLVNNGRWSGGPSDGGGLYVSGTDVMIVDCMITNNGTRSYAYGAGVCVRGGSLAVTNCIFDSNSAAYGRGAGAYVEAPARFVNCVFSGNNDNFCNGATLSRGGALGVSVGASTTVTVENCTVVDNYAKNDGGAVFVFAGNLAVKNSIFWDNVADDQYASPGDGGDTIYNDAGNGAVVIDYCCLAGTSSNQLAGDDFTLSFVTTNDPLFAVEYSDVHLKSKFGRWAPALAGWTNDEVTSLCIDAGDPDSRYLREPMENGGCINLGAYGNTAQASKSPPAGGTVFVIR